MAEYLNLQHAVNYMEHAFRSSATLLANKVVDILRLKQHGDWKSSSAAERYVNRFRRSMRSASLAGPLFRRPTRRYFLHHVSTFVATSHRDYTHFLSFLTLIANGRREEQNLLFKALCKALLSLIC